MSEEVQKSPDLKEANNDETFDFGVKKKRKKKKAAIKATNKVVDGTGEVWQPEEPYNYSELLDRVALEVEEFNPKLAGAKTLTLKPPVVARVGSKRVAWTNFNDICGALNRDTDHLRAFVLSELGTDGSLAQGGAHLVLKGRYTQKHIENLLRKYIAEYVTCSMCHSSSTTLVRDPSSRLYDINCQSCGAAKSVTNINRGFQAVGRGDRRAARMTAAQ